MSIGDVISFTYGEKTRYAYVLNPEYNGKCHAMALEKIPRQALIGEIVSLTEYDNLSPNPKSFYDNVVGRSNVVEYDAYRTFIVSKMSDIERVEYTIFGAMWQRPPVEELQLIINNTALRFNLNSGELQNQAENGALMTWPDRAWRRLRNSMSYTVPVGGIDQIINSFGNNDIRDSISDLQKAFNTGTPIDAPMILFLSDDTQNTPYLMTGEVKMMYARARGIVPKVWLVSLTTNTE
jgi:hypothetical protein